MNASVFAFILWFMIYIELPFVSRAGVYLENFTHKGGYLWAASCPICGDISKGRKKKRFYIYAPVSSTSFNVRCHHCGYSTSFVSFLKTKFPELYKEYVFEKYNKEGTPVKSKTSLKPIAIPNKQKEELLTDSFLDGLKCCLDLPSDHPVVKYLAKRAITGPMLKHFYYTMKFKKYTNSIIKNKFPEPLKEDHPRLIIPFFNSHGKMTAFQARAFDDTAPKYYTIKLEEGDRIYGLDRVDFSKPIFAVEGPIDSLFLDNCIAVCGSSFDCDTLRKLKTNITLIFDNEPRSKEICKSIDKHILLGYKVCLLPHSIKTKDINEHILSGMTKQQIHKLIEENTYQGAEARLRFSAWKLVI